MKSIAMYVALFTTLLYVQASLATFYAGENQVENPEVPAALHFPNPPSEQTVFKLDGTPTGGRFTVDLKWKAGFGGDVNYHFDVRTDVGIYGHKFKNLIVQNSYIDGSWGKEENKQYEDGTFPFENGKLFHLEIKIKKDFFEAHLNGEKLAEYKHRLPVSSMSFALVHGDINVKSMSFV